MKVSLNWVEEYLHFDLPAVDELTAKIGAQLGAIEAVEDLGKKYQGIVVAKIATCKDQPNADRLHVCLIDDGGVVADATRDENGHIQVVCGAPNAREGLLVAWLPPGTTVPETYGKEPFVLTAREFRGVMSNGMLASARELALGSDHSGIVELDPHDAKPGDDFAKIYQLDDYIIDIENKMFTHRPDCFGELGVAREIAGILNRPFTSPDWYSNQSYEPRDKSQDELPLEVHNELPELVPRFMAVAMHIGSIGPSPIWMRSYLTRVGIRPINNAVDITNYLMLLTAQPLHAYDYDKVKALSAGNAATLVVRYPKPDEKLQLLNGKEITPREQAILIATDRQSIGLGGVMGGAETEVDDNTKNIILECATFDMYSIRRTSMAHGLFTDAVTRFNKGQSPLQNNRIVGEALRLYSQLMNATQASAIIDVKNQDCKVKPAVVMGPHGKEVTIFEWDHMVPPITVTAQFVNGRLGTKLTAEAMCELLRNVEFSAHTDNHENPDEIEIIAPFWRTDIELPEDVVEEVGRLYGFDHLPLDLPKRVIEPAKKDPILELKARVRNVLSRGGANEVLTYSFVPGNLLGKVGQDRSQAFQVSNAISPDLQYYRLSLTPSLLDKVHQNIKAGYDKFALFELGKAHTVSEKDEEGLPREVNTLSLVVASDDKVAKSEFAGAPYYQALKYLLYVLNEFHARLLVGIEPLAGADLYKNPWIEQMVAPYEPGRSAVLRDDRGLLWGVVGEFKPSVRKAMKLPEYTCGFEVDPLLFAQANKQNRYAPLPRFPKVEQDICLKVPAATTFGQVFEFVWRQIKADSSERAWTLTPIDIYQREDDPDHKQITLRVTIASYERTLTDEEVAKLLDNVAAKAKATLNADRV